MRWRVTCNQWLSVQNLHTNRSPPPSSPSSTVHSCLSVLPPHLLLLHGPKVQPTTPPSIPPLLRVCLALGSRLLFRFGLWRASHCVFVFLHMHLPLRGWRLDGTFDGRYGTRERTTLGYLSQVSVPNHLFVSELSFSFLFFSCLYLFLCCSDSYAAVLSLYWLCWGQPQTPPSGGRCCQRTPPWPGAG